MLKKVQIRLERDRLASKNELYSPLETTPKPEVGFSEFTQEL